MHEAIPSRTAFRVAVRRAVHQILDRPPVFEDPLAVAIVGAEAANQFAQESAANDHPASRALRAFVAVRNRFAEDELAQAVARGVRQYVVLGAGLDTFAYRNAHVASGLRVFEVDHPATQAWKRERLAEAGIAIPSDLTFVPVNFEHDTLPESLREAGFQTDRSAFFAWLGVVPYLTDGAFAATMNYIATLPPDSGVVFDYSIPRSSLSFLEQRVFDAMAARVARAGEPFQLFFEPEALAARLRGIGFSRIEDLSGVALNGRYFADRTDGLRPGSRAAHLLYAEI